MVFVVFTSARYIKEVEVYKTIWLWAGLIRERWLQWSKL